MLFIDDRDLVYGSCILRRCCEEYEKIKSLEIVGLSYDIVFLLLLLRNMRFENSILHLQYIYIYYIRTVEGKKYYILLVYDTVYTRRLILPERKNYDCDLSFLIRDGANSQRDSPGTGPERPGLRVVVRISSLFPWRAHAHTYSRVIPLKRTK